MAAKRQGIDIDVIGDFPRRFDKAIDAFRDRLESVRGQRLIVAGTVKEMVDKILRRLSQTRKHYSPAFPQSKQKNYSDGDSPKINRLRIFGHSNGNYVALSRFKEVTHGTIMRTPRDFGQETYKRALSADVLGYGSEEKFYYGGNGKELRRLVGRFSPRGWVELHACWIAPGFRYDFAASKIGHDRYGLYLMKALARLWKVPVKGGSDKQNPLAGLEGEVVVAYPNGRIERRGPKPQRKPPPCIPTMTKDRSELECGKPKCGLSSNMATDGPCRGEARTPNVLARGVVSNRQPILG